MEPVKANLVGMDLEDLEAVFRSLGEPAYRARQFFSALYRRRVQDLDRVTEFSRSLRQKLKLNYEIRLPEAARVACSNDGSKKYLLRLEDGSVIETVYMPEARRTTFCISSQVGCALECTFCMTGTLGLGRHLETSEIVGQVLQLLNRETAGDRVNVVFMGMGEPLHNYDRVMKAFRILSHPEGVSISPRRITLSTVGLLPGIQRLAREPVLPNLAISLNAPDDHRRSQLMPINDKYPIASLVEACRQFPLKKRRRITFEYVLMAGVNDSDADALKLVKLLKRLKCKVNLIAFNPGPLVPFQRPTDQRVKRFQEVLCEHGMTAMIRQSRGRDIDAACGQLAARSQG
ncbi:MAG: 23S rRNA (adenine(2503)-C(2))-methyltransferase RlmN [Acidobacteria bacterium]|nr:23S rRNA (adenine(2503)-C(2))-methyltransferase RlmN [Acidobacteriota bacterium]